MKKQIAVLMAAATAVTTVAPAIANADMTTHNSTSVATVNAEIKKALETRYADPKQDGINNANADKVDDYLNSRYAVIVATDGEIANGVKTLKEAGYDTLSSDVNAETLANKYVVEDATKVAREIERLSVDRKSVKVYVVDKGIKDKSSVYTTTKKHYIKGNKTGSEAVTDTTVELGSIYDYLINAKGDGKAPTFVDEITVYVNGKKFEGSGALDKANIDKIELKLKSGEMLTLEVNGEALDFEKAFAKDGQELDLEAKNDQSVFDKVVKFDTLANKEDKEVTLDVTTGDTDLYVVKDLVTKTIEINDVYTTEKGYSEAGASFVNRFIDAKESPFVFNYNGTSYKLNPALGTTLTDALNNSRIEADGEGYTLSFEVPVVDKNDGDRGATLQFKINGKTQNDLAFVQKDLKYARSVVAGQFMKLVGQNRYATAVEVSKENFEDDKSAESVVITGGEAIMDGLSAVPLASAKKAPILLADKNGLSSATMNEIDRVLDKKYAKTLYIVGGKSSVPESVEKQLKDRFDVAVVRLAGSNRYDTSLEVAKRLSYDTDTDENVFVVGGEGAADAMSVSPVAADKTTKTSSSNKVSPILVVPKDGINKNQRDYIAQKKFTKRFVIGGEGTVATQVIRDLKSEGTDSERIAGSNRYATNLDIINKFYSEKEKNDMINVSGLLVTSGDSRYLVDAQTAGPLAAAKNAPILLTGSTLNKDQMDAIKKDGVLSKVKTDVYQIGGVVSSAVMKEVVKTLGL